MATEWVSAYLLMGLPLQRSPSPLPLQCEGGDQALDLGGLAVGLAVLALKGAPVCVHVLAHVIILGQVEELPDLGSPLGTPQTGLVLICQPRQLSWPCDTQTVRMDLSQQMTCCGRSQGQRHTFYFSIVMLFEYRVVIWLVTWQTS